MQALNFSTLEKISSDPSQQILLSLHMRFTLLISFYLVCFTHHAQSIERQVFASSGLSASTMEFTIGEVFTAAISNPPSLITQGFHQSNLIHIGVDEIANHSFAIFPNPTRSSFALNYSMNSSTICVEILDAQSALVKICPAVTNGQWIMVEDLAAGTYIIRTRDQQHNVITHHRLIKL